MKVCIKEIENELITRPITLHLEVYVHKHKFRRVLVDSRVGLNIFTLKVVKTFGLYEACVDIIKRIIIKAYDDKECSSKGFIKIPIRVGPKTLDTTFQVLDLDLPYNLLLCWPWIHAMKSIPYTYHQCLKFPYDSTAIIIDGDPNPFQYCNNLRGTPKQQGSINQEASSSTSSHYINPSTLNKASTSKPPSSSPKV